MYFMFDIPREVYKKATLNQRLLWDMISEEANNIFHKRVMDIIVSRQPKGTFPRDWDINTQLQYTEMKNEHEGAIHCYVRLKFLYESEFGEISEKLESEIKEIAEGLADRALVKCGWIKESEVKANV